MFFASRMLETIMQESARQILTGQPAVGYVMAKTGVTLADVAFSRPRQVTCLDYNNIPEAAGCPLT